MKKVVTYLPVFPGFYNTIFEPDTDNEIYHINSERVARGLPEVDDDQVEFDYKEYEERAVKDVASYIERELKNLKFVSDITIQRIVSPKEYNFKNDSADVIISLSIENEAHILAYLEAHTDDFASYLKDRYTSRSGFISFYPNNVAEFMSNKPLLDAHKLGSILDFICENENITSENAYYSVEAYLSATNYHDLLP